MKLHWKKLNWKERLSGVIAVTCVAWYWFDAARKGEVRESLVGLVGVFAFMGILIVIDVILAKRKSTAWMARYHLGLLVVLSLAVISYCGVSLMRGMSAR